MLQYDPSNPQTGIVTPERTDMKDPLRGSRVLVTGANGFIGRHLCRELSAIGVRLAVMDRDPVACPGKHTAHIGDMTDRAWVRRCVARVKPSYVFHLAAFKPRSARLEDFRPALDSNLMGTLNLLEPLAGCAGLTSVIVMGTADEYGSNPVPFREDQRPSPINVYSCSKICMTTLAETMHALYRLPVTVVRPTVAYGPGQGPDMYLPAMIMALLGGKSFPMTRGGQTRDFIFIDDLIQGLLAVARCPRASGKVLNLSTNAPVSIKDVARCVRRMIGRGSVRLGAVPYRVNETMRYAADNARARKITGWRPRVSLEEGLRRTIDWYARERTA